LYLGGYTHPARRTYKHPAPAVTRILLFRNGRGLLSAGGRMYTLSPGVIYLVPDGQDFVVTYEPCELYYAHLHITDHAGQSVFGALRGIGIWRQRRLHDQLVKGIRHHDWHSAQACLFEVLVHFLEPLLPQLEERALQGERYAGLLSALQHEPIGRISVRELAARLHRSRTTLSRDFHRAMGTPLKTYLQDLALQRARDALRFTEKTVRQIAFELGFSAPGYFHHFFKRRAKLTPEQYRRAMRRSYDAELPERSRI
jgi:AraC-like DNA-binding protein